MTNLYLIQHLALVIDDPRDLLAATAEKMIGHFRQLSDACRQPASSRSVLELEAHRDRQRSHSEELPRIWQGGLDGLHFAVFRRGPRRRIELPGRAVVDFDLEAGWAKLCVYESGDDAAKRILLLRVVCDALTREGHSFVHGACLAAPVASQWRGVVITAPSHTGKTTTALALADSGWRLLGDDVTYVRPPNLGTAVWGFPRSCHIRPGTFRLLPWLADLELGPPDAEGTRAVAMTELRNRAWINGPWLQPALVVVLAAPNRRATRVESIDRAAALSQLAAESVTAVPGVCDDQAARDFVTLGRLVCAAPACRLSVGPNVADVAEKLERFLVGQDHEKLRRGSRSPKRLERLKRSDPNATPKD